jgi:uncharacterized protein (DUF305 family)
METMNQSTQPTRRIFSGICSTALLACASICFAVGPAPTQDQRRFEVRFLTEMIDHHTMAVMMSDLCLERAFHPQLIQLCHQIRETQLEEIATMQTWLEGWYGINHEPEMTTGMRKQMQKLAALSGAEFEIEFIKMMIRHHWTAVVRAEQCQEKAYHSELIRLCANIETTQLAEIELMGSWLCGCYDICNYHGSTN